MKWYYQHIPGETQDMDEVFENILIDVDGRKSLFKMGKLGILWQLDRTTGAFVHATDLGYQNILEVEPETGKVTYRPGKIPEIGVQLDMCPSTAGFKSWRAMAYSPQTNALYMPMNLNCEKATFGRGREKTLGRRRHRTRAAQELPGTRRRTATSANSGRSMSGPARRCGAIARRRRRIPPRSRPPAALVFGGDWDRHMYAYDAATGQILWQTRLPTSAQGFPITYLANGKQYVAMPAGNRRRQLVDADRAGTGARDPAAEQRQRR